MAQYRVAVVLLARELQREYISKNPMTMNSSSQLWVGSKCVKIEMGINSPRKYISGIAVNRHIFFTYHVKEFIKPARGQQDHDDNKKEIINNSQGC